MNQDLHSLSCVILNLANLDFALVVGLQNGVYQARRRRAKGNFRDRQGLLINHADACTNTDLATAVAIIVSRGIGNASRREIWHQLEATPLQMLDGCVNQLYKVVRHDLRRQTHRNTLSALRQKQWEFHRKRQGFTSTTIIARLPISDLRIEGYLQSKLAQARLDITRGRGTIAC